MAGLTGAGELVRLDIPAQPAFVGVARSVIAAVASVVDGIDDDRLEDLRVAVSEAATNALASHTSDASDERVVLTCTSESDRLVVCIEDSGDGFDPDGVPEPPAIEDAPTARSERGWGIQLIQALVDDVTFRKAGTGTAVDLVMRLDRPD